MASIEGVHHVNLAVTDLDGARHFYGSRLGLTELHRPEVGGQGAWFDLGGAQLHLSVVETMPPRTMVGLPHLALRLAADEFGPYIDALRHQDVAFVGEVRTRVTEGREWSNIFCTDPDGNAIELTDLPATPF
jgi:glyoxylase I family protein